MTEEELKAIEERANEYADVPGPSFGPPTVLQLVAEVRRLRNERETCNGSCDIALARRQVGPDAVVPSSARECAELWEREASRLNAELATLDRLHDAAIAQAAHDRAGHESWKAIATTRQEAMDSFAARLDAAEAEVVELRALLAEAHQDPDNKLTSSLLERIENALARKS